VSVDERACDPWHALVERNPTNRLVVRTERGPSRTEGAMKNCTSIEELDAIGATGPVPTAKSGKQGATLSRAW
jgi:hypothetical protein